MKPYYEDNHETLYNLNFMDNDLPDESVQMVVTSPPYWGLRKYSGEQDLIWGGEMDCQHEWQLKSQKVEGGFSGGKDTSTIATRQSAEKRDNGTSGEVATGFCQLCGAWRGAYGLEPTPELYVQHTIEILREIRRVLRKDGVVFWNIGDSYVSHRPRQNAVHTATKDKEQAAAFGAAQSATDLRGKGIYKDKDLCLIPFRVAIAAQEDGWWVRSDIIWSKPNPMPESVTDRPTNSHEYILMLTKSAKYYWDADAVREPPSESTLYRAGWPNDERPNGKRGKGDGRGMVVDGSYVPPNGRNLRSVWTFPTQPYPEAHFAVFPEKLPELCIKAATPEVGCCSKCGKPWTRVLEKGLSAHDGETHGKSEPTDKGNAGAYGRLAQLRQAARERGGEYINETKTLGWQPQCKCNAEKVPSTVLDPFAGAGTTLWVAKKLNRRSIGFEISEEYCQLIVDRTRQGVIL